MTKQTKQILIDAAEAARMDEAASRETLGRLITQGASAPALGRSGYNWQLAAARLNEVEKALADVRGKELDRIVTAITVAVAIAFLLFVSISAVLRVNDTRGVAKVTAPQVKLALAGQWEFPREVGARRVFVSPVALLGVSGRPTTKFTNGASIELAGEVTLTDFSVLPGTGVRLFAEKDLVTFDLEGAEAGAAGPRLLAFTINVMSTTKLNIDQGTPVEAHELLAAGSTLSIGVAFAPGQVASLELDKPNYNLLRQSLIAGVLIHSALDHPIQIIQFVLLPNALTDTFRRSPPAT